MSQVTSSASDITDPFGDIIGQQAAIEQLRAAVLHPVHAYLFLGPRGAGKRRAAVRFAGELIGTPGDRQRNRSLAVREEHADVIVVEPAGNSFLMEEADAVVVEASRSPMEAGKKVLILDRFHDADDRIAANLLKTIEEPPGATVFILLAERVPPEHITVASRSVTIEFPAVAEDEIRRALIDRGTPPELAATTAQGALGDVDRAELLLTDPAFVSRRDLWLSIPDRLDGTGAVVGTLVGEIFEAIEEAQTSLNELHAGEVVQMDETEELTGTRGSGRGSMQTRHKREVRLHKTDELKMGLATLAHQYRKNMLHENAPLDVFDVLRDATSALSRNPNEELWLTNTLLQLSSR